jgi:hypothetical protein
MTRRGALLLVALAATAGCLSPALGVSAAPAGVPNETLDAAGFVGPAPRPVNVSVPVGVGPAVVNANVTSHVVVYADADSAVFANATALPGGDASAPPANATPTTLVVLSTPGFRTAGVTLNPLTRRPDPAMVERVADLLADVPGAPAATVSGEVTAVERRDLTVLGRPTRVTTYAGNRTGATRLTLATVEHGCDVLVLVGTHDGDGAAADRLVDLMAHVDHPSDATGNLPENRTRPGAPAQ